MTKPRLFWDTATVTRPDGTTADWFVEASAEVAYPGQYTVEVRVQRPRGAYTYKGFEVTHLDGRPRTSAWDVSSPYDAHPLNRIISSDGYDFGSLKEAVWAILDRCLRHSLEHTFANESTVAFAEIDAVLGNTARLHPKYRVATFPRPQAATA